MKILLIEDNPGDIELIGRALKQSSCVCDFHTENWLGAALDRPDLESFDIILTDLTLPDACDLASVEKLVETLPTTPVVVLTSLTDDELAVEAIRRGAQDYIVKDHANEYTLNRSIRHSVERQAMWSENERLLADLEESKELLEKKNAKLQELCEAAQQSIDNISHEFRTPLTVIIEYASIIGEGIVGDVNDEQRRFLDVIADRGNDLNNMVNDMLDVSRLESGVMGISRDEHSAEEIIDHVESSLMRKALVRGVELSTSIQPDLPMIYCDAEKIGRVIINLSINALKFASEKGHVSIDVRQTNESEVEFAITDDGPGIPPEKLEEIFERFSQLCNTPTYHSTKGFGLGLNIAQTLVNLNFGTMAVDSVVNEGSTFRFTVPIFDPVRLVRRYLEWLKVQPDGCDTVNEIVVTCDSTDESDEIDSFLRYLVRPFDFVFRAERNRWMLLVNTPRFEVETVRKRILNEHEFLSRNRPLGPLSDVQITVGRTWTIGDAVRDLAETVNCRTEEICYA
ncbi:hybrid sensor histidine kinase/response regulator [Roseiconus lacunae]|uniref:histidine kinase n=1 Tax=Roseiconus lacunae TaxID=2605694 RepID=A0ABT7PNZ1_9BACT|nr:ATP-binding protein [Roseiconus lacunae]MCD0462123.1 response regulator [Roseiconus lacunae]MDM4018011.1 ATP-binding protein [Roseiconus lacunae]WRQ50712.1 ATP-binding protein [Stieleria sp. HD01]